MRVGVVQCRAIYDDIGATCDAIVRWLCWADNAAVDLIVFPEALLLGHSYNPAIIRARAEQASRSALAALCSVVAAFRATLVVGAFDLVDAGVCNSAFVIERGRIVGRYAKAFPNETGVTAGMELPTFVRSGVRYGINICNGTRDAPTSSSMTCRKRR